MNSRTRASANSAIVLVLILSITAASGSGRYSDEEVIASIDGIVPGGNYTRYTFSEKDNSQLVLTTM